MLNSLAPAPAVATLLRVHAPALHDLSLTVNRGEILTLLGTSPGSGASTALWLLGGFVRATSGRVSLGGRLMDATPPHDRRFGMVTRTLALFPHLDVAGHARFAPGVSGAQADAILQRLDLSAFARRRPQGLPAEIRFRIALARALATSPPLLLLEDPAVALPPAAAASIKALLRSIAAETGLAVLHASDDVNASYGFSDRIGVIQSGHLRQIGTPQELYDRPDSLAVAQTMGPLNRLNGRVIDCDDDLVRVRLAGGITVEARAVDPLEPGEPCVVALRPERIAVAAVQAAEMGDGAVPARLVETVFAGDQTRLRFSIDIRGDSLPDVIVTRPSGAAPLRGATVCLAWQPHHAHAFRTASA